MDLSSRLQIVNNSNQSELFGLAIPSLHPRSDKRKYIAKAWGKYLLRRIKNVIHRINVFALNAIFLHLLKTAIKLLWGGIEMFHFNCEQMS